MTEERFLVTGASGCIGAWTVRSLVREGTTVATFDCSQNQHRLELLLSPDEIQVVSSYHGDVSRFEDVLHAFEDFQPTHVIHLAAMQLPFCKADPIQGAQTNVVGTVNLFEAVKRIGLKMLVYASSTAVYGTADEYPQAPLAHDADLNPHSHYGVYKAANEGNAKVYWQDDGIASIGLRPYTVYGAGRDQGLTSTPTKAMLAAAVGRPYHISYGGRCAFQYGDDTGKINIMAARQAFHGQEVFNIGGDSISVSQVIEAIEKLEPDMRGKITYTDQPLPFPPDVDNQELVKVLGPLPHTSLLDGVKETIDTYRAAVNDGSMTMGDVDAILA
jgi:nucleoside-diphosphate-sugar epimerase